VRIGVVTSAHRLFDNRIFFKQAVSLVKAGHQVTLMASADEEFQERDGVQILRVPRFKNRSQRFLLSVPGLLIKAWRGRYDALHFHDPEFILFLPILKLFCRAKIVFDIHEDNLASIKGRKWIPKLFRRPVGWLYWFLEKIFLQFADFIILAEDSYVENYRGYKKREVIHNFSLDPKFSQSSSAAVRYDFAYLGGLKKDRGLFDFIEILSLLKTEHSRKARMILIGNFDSAVEKQEFEKLIEERDLKDQIEWKGFLPLQEALALTAQAKIGLALLHNNPNYIHSYPTKIFDYMSLKMPSIVYDIPLWRSMVAGSECGLVVPMKDVSAAARGLHDLLEDPSRISRMGENAHAAFKSKYSWAAEEEKLKRIYENLLN